MSYLDQVLDVQVIASVRAVRQRGFGVPALLAYHSFWTDLARVFTDPSELVEAGVDTDHPIYLWATSLYAQEPAPTSFVILRRTRVFTQVVEFTPETPELGKQYSVDMDGVTVAYEADADDDVDAVVDGLLAAATAASVTGITRSGQPSVPYTKLRCTSSTAGVLHSYTNVVGLAVKDTTANPGSGGIAADFAAAIAAPNGNGWYGLNIDSQSAAEIAALAPSIETAKKIFAYSTADTDAQNGTSGNIFETMQTAGYARSMGTYHPSPLQYFSAAIFGRQLAKQPGSTNWAWKAALAGVDYYELTGGQYAAIDTDNGNHYTDFAGQGYGVFLYGKTASGSFIDVPHFCDWMKARMQERLILLMVNAEKVGQTSIGVQQIATQVYAQVQEGIDVGGLDPDDANAVVDIPTIAEIPVANLANRVASGFKARRRLAAPFNKVDDLIMTLTV